MRINRKSVLTAMLATAHPKSMSAYTAPLTVRFYSEIARESCMQLRDSLLNVYNATTTASFSELSNLVSDEQMMTASESLHYGFVDQIV